MLMYGVYVSRIKNVNWGNVVGMLKNMIMTDIPIF